MNTPQHLPEPEPAHDWAEDLAHERLVDETLTHLLAAESAALAAEDATMQLGYAQLARDLATGDHGAAAADHQPPRRLTVRDAAAVLLLTVHATAWLAVSIVQPSVSTALTCLAAYGAALATLALLLTTGPDDPH
ncbi:hypothetical protein [Streptomyces sp. DSM 41013]